MAEALYPPRDRLSLRAYIRARLRGRGLLEFADDDEEARTYADLVYMNCGREWHEDARRRTQFELDAMLATTTDNPMQGIGNTVLNNNEFWSSTGASSGAAGEVLLYRLSQPLGRVAYVSIAVYRALYQHGDPLYPPSKVSFLTGPTPNQLYPASPIYPVRLTDEQQVFALNPTAAVSQYLMVRMHGRRQRQWEDLQYYIAIRHVAAYGNSMHPSYGIQIASLVRSSALAWPCTRGLMAAVAAGGRGAAEPPYGTGGRGAAAAASLWTPFRRHAGREPREQVPDEDVYEAGPQSVEESRRVYVAAGFRRGAPRRLLVSERGLATAVASLPATVQSRSRRPRALMPSGPTGSELRLAVQQAGLLRALPHLVHVPWPEMLVVRQPQQHQQRASRSPGGTAALGACSAAAAAVPSGRSGQGGLRDAGQRHRADSAAANAAAGPSSQSRTPPQRASETMAESKNGGGSVGLAEAGPIGRMGALQRLREWVVAAAAGAAGSARGDTAAAAPTAGSSGDTGAGTGPRNSAGGGRRLLLQGDTSSGTSTSSGSDPRDRNPAGGGAAATAPLGGPRKGPPTRGSSSDSDGPAPPLCSAASAAMAAAGRMQAELLASGAHWPADSPLTFLSALLHSATLNLQGPGGAGAAASVAAGLPPALALADAHSAGLRRIRPEQVLPPPKLRRRGDGGPEASAGKGSAAGSRGNGEAGMAAASVAYGRVEGQRRRRHQRTAQRAMQQAVYRPDRGGALFVALEAWAGMGDSGAAAAWAAVAGGDGNAGSGCWLVSHYDHEHL